MRRIAAIAICFLAAQCHAGESQAKFDDIAKRLADVVQRAVTNAVISQTDRSFKAEFDSMVYTVHGGSKTGEYSPRTHQETGPRLNGFVIDMSLNPLNPIAAPAGQTYQTPYWQEFFWHGHADDKDYIHFIFKFGKRVDDNLKQEVIKVVTGTAQQPPAN